MKEKKLDMIKYGRLSRYERYVFKNGIVVGIFYRAGDIHDNFMGDLNGRKF